MFLYAGAIVPCDGIFLTGRGVACDETKREGTGPGAGTFRKVSMEHIARMMYHADPRIRYSDCFMHSGDRVLEGSGRYVVTAVNNEEMDPLRTWISEIIPDLPRLTCTTSCWYVSRAG